MKRNPCQRKQKNCTMDCCVNNNINPIVVRHQANARERYRTHRFAFQYLFFQISIKITLDI